jgi:DNA-directed RNA polymerase subunit RPC12/RpoP
MTVQKKAATVETSYKCRFCGGALELAEDSRYLWFGCRRCLRYVKREKMALVRRFVDRRKRRLNWRGMMSELYWLYTK